MKKLSSIVLVFIFSIINLYSDDQFHSKDKDWEVKFYPKMKVLKTITHGQVVWGNEFGFVKNQTNCSTEYIWFSISSYEKDIDDVKDKELLLNFNIDNKEYKLKAKVSFINELTPIMKIVTFTRIEPKEKFIELLKKNKSIKIELLGPAELVKKFDIPYESFSLDGFIENYTKFNESCKDLSQLNMPVKK